MLHHSGARSTMELFYIAEIIDSRIPVSIDIDRGDQTKRKAKDIELRANQVGAMFGLFFTDQAEVSSFSQVSACEVEIFKRFFHQMLARGINFAPSAYETGFVSAMHGVAEIEQTIEAAAATFAEL